MNLAAFATPWPDLCLLHLVQATAFGLLVVVVLALRPRLGAGAGQFLVWTALVKFMLPLSLLGLALPFGQGALRVPASLFHVGLAPATAGGAQAGWIGWLFPAVWAAGMLVTGGWAAARGLAQARRLRRRSEPFPPDLARRLVQLADVAGVGRRAVAGWVSPDEGPPGVSGIFRSRINVPRELLQTLAPDEVDAVLLHELAHVARRDNLWRLLQTGIVVLFWFHPLVWWLHRRYVVDGERACDDRVVRLIRNRDAYARGLVKAARSALGLGLPGFSGMAAHGLEHRVAAILHPPTRKDPPMLRFALIGLTMTGFILTAGATGSEPPAADTYAIAQLDTPPKVVSQVPPEYPAELRENRVTGHAVIEFVVDSTGKVARTSVVTATNVHFGEAAAAAVRQWSFSPGRHGGRAVNTILRQDIVFSLP